MQTFYLNLTPKLFTQLARSVQAHLRSSGVELTKGHYCHILEATARGLGFSSKSDMDQKISRAKDPVRVDLDESIAVQWFQRAGFSNDIPDGFLTSTLRDAMTPVNAQPNL